MAIQTADIGISGLQLSRSVLYADPDKRGPMPARASSLAEPTPGPQRLDQSRFDPANRRRLSPPALRTFLAIADLWGLAEEQRRLVLGYPSRSTYHSWCRRARA